MRLPIPPGETELDLSTLLTYAVALFIAAIIPGPGMTAIVARALGGGMRPAAFMGLGLVLGDLCYLTAVCLGLAYVAQAFGTLFVVIKMLGAAYLLFVAWKLWRQGLLPQDIQAQDIQGQQGRDAGGAFLSGLLVTLGNPKTMLFYVALVPSLLPIEQIDGGQYVVLIGLTTAVLLVALVPYVVLAGQARVALRRPSALKALNRTAAGILASTAAYVTAKAA